MSTANKAPVSNSAAFVDFNKEVGSFMLNNAAALGRELKLAVAIHNDVASFNPADTLGGVGAKNKATALRNAMLLQSASFKEACDKADVLKKKAAQKTDAGFRATIEYQAAQKTIQAAISMFERACVLAYFLRSASAVISKVTDKALHFKATRAVTIGDVTYDAGGAVIMTRKDAYETGRKLCVERGILGTKPKSRIAAGDGVATGSAKTVVDSAATLADTVSKMPTAMREDVSTSQGFEKMLATALRARFAADGVIDIVDIVDFLHGHDAMVGVRIEGVTPATRGKKSA